MRKDFDAVEASYISHSTSYEGYGEGETKNDIAKTWLDSDTLNAHRCKKMYQLVDPFIQQFPTAQWLTVGDGRFGCDAIYLKQQGANVTASDLCDKLLIEAHAKGLIDNYSQENAETLSFDDDAFDFVYCKEAYHHFPRPSIALYEMLRVAKQGVVLLEPIDREILPWHQTLFLNLKNLIKKALRKPVARDFFEEDGNYLYSVSKREFEKIALGLGYRHIVFQGINDIYIPNMEFTPFDKSQPLFQKWQKKQALYDRLSKLGLIPYNLLFTAFFKAPLKQGAIMHLKNLNYEVIELPENPYLKDT